MVSGGGPGGVVGVNRLLMAVAVGESGPSKRAPAPFSFNSCSTLCV